MAFDNCHFPGLEWVMVIVGHCPRCDAPVYAPNRWRGQEAPPISHACECRNYRAWSDHLSHTSQGLPATWGGEWPHDFLAQHGLDPLAEVPHAKQVGTQPDSTADTVV